MVDVASPKTAKGDQLVLYLFSDSIEVRATPTGGCGQCEVYDVWPGCVLCVLKTYPCTYICAYKMPLPFTSDCQEEVHHNLHPFNQAPQASGVLLSDAFSSSCVLSRHSRYTCNSLHRACEHTLTTDKPRSFHRGRHNPPH